MNIITTYHSSRLALLGIFIGWISLSGSTGASAQSFSMFGEAVSISARDISPDNPTIYFTDNWKFSPQDSLRFADSGYDDSNWESVSTRLGESELAFIDWKGVGWFRLTIEVDSTLAGEPLALLLVQHNGASEIYLNGDLMYELGTVATTAENTRPQTDMLPRYIHFDRPGRHILAVRYANYKAQRFNELGFTAGFRMLFGDLDYHIKQSADRMLSSSTIQMFFTGALLAFTIIHFLFFFFYPVERNNAYFSIFTGFLAILTYSSFKTDFATSPLDIITFYRLSIVVWILTIVYALRFTYSLFYKETPKQFWLFLVIGVSMAGVTWFRHEWTIFYRELFVLLTILEIIRVLFTAFHKKKEGVWIIGTGLFMFVGGILYAIAANTELVSGEASTGNFVGSVSLILAMSVFLSRKFAKTNKQLEHKLIEVKQLSERSLEQERINKEKELERALLESENKRKTRELEEARTLQLSMLPRQIPELPQWDISVYMDTAQEVGGDYYDFSLARDGTLSVALGDATGHGMKAGIMVATAKSYFHTLANDHNNLDTVRRMSSGIRNMDLKIMFMGMILLKCSNHEIKTVVAGMPPMLLYRRETDEVEELRYKGMPLGTKADFPYEEHTLQLQKGDALLMMSDGLTELFNKKREMLGVERIASLFSDIASSSASDIISQVKNSAIQWSGGTEHEDDITLMVLKAK